MQFLRTGRHATSAAIRFGWAVLAGGDQHFVERGEVGFGAGNDDIGIGAVAAKGARLADLRSGRPSSGRMRLPSMRTVTSPRASMPSVTAWTTNSSRRAGACDDAHRWLCRRRPPGRCRPRPGRAARHPGRAGARWRWACPSCRRPPAGHPARRFRAAGRWCRRPALPGRRR